MKNKIKKSQGSLWAIALFTKGSCFIFILFENNQPFGKMSSRVISNLKRVIYCNICYNNVDATFFNYFVIFFFRCTRKMLLNMQTMFNELCFNQSLSGLLSWKFITKIFNKFDHLHMHSQLYNRVNQS